MNARDDKAPPHSDFYKYWSNLWETDPMRFDMERKAEFEKIISSAPPRLQEHLRNLVKNLSLATEKQTDPIVRMHQSFKAMVDYFSDAKEGFLSIQGRWLEALEEAIEMKIELSELDGTDKVFKQELMRFAKK